MNLVRSTYLHIMSSLKLIPFALLLLMLSCSKKGNDSSNDPTDPSLYRLAEMKSVLANSDHDESYTFSYNSQNQVSEIKWVQRGLGGTSQNPTVVENTVVFSFTYQNNLAVQCVRKAGQETKTITYQYNGNRVNSKVIRSNVGAQIDSTIYNYGVDGKANEVYTYYDNRLSSRLAFTYTNDLTTIIYYINEFSGETKTKFEFSGYDSNVNFMSAISGLPALPGVTDFPFTRDVSLSQNNHKNQKAYPHVGASEEFKAPWLNLNLSYEYNNAGLPTNMKFTDGQYKFRYNIVN